MPSTISTLNGFVQKSTEYRKHFTASAVIIEQSHILLVHHKRIGAWLPPGGHVEENEFPHQTAIRETKEETGLDISITSPTLPTTVSSEAFFLPEPLCIHAVHAKEAKGAFYHIDLAYLCQLAGAQKGLLPQILSNEEIHSAAWVELDKLEEIPLAKNVVEIVSLAKAKLGE